MLFYPVFCCVLNIHSSVSLYSAIVLPNIKHRQSDKQCVIIFC
jgi:hypothetical protein